MIRAIMTARDIYTGMYNYYSPDINFSEILEFDSIEEFNEANIILSRYEDERNNDIRYKLIELIPNPSEVLEKAKIFVQKKEEEQRIKAEKALIAKEKNKKTKLLKQMNKLKKELEELDE